MGSIHLAHVGFLLDEFGDGQLDMSWQELWAAAFGFLSGTEMSAECSIWNRRYLPKLRTMSVADGAACDAISAASWESEWNSIHLAVLGRCPEAGEDDKQCRIKLCDGS